ncbi:MAG: hypothetical protein K1Y02_06670 [Candidatus Hydrogenedentes bacterium]|nr:hypothetical protein [Candidatus Hydrogenedentota bacterium]
MHATLKRVFTGLAAVTALLWSQTAQADQLLHARVSYESGGAMVKGSSDADWSYATNNTLIMPGDTLWVDNDGLLELEMAGGTFLRMADGSKAEITQVPPSAQVRGWIGSFYVQRVNRSNGDVSFRTPAATITVENDTHVRFDIVGEGATTVSVRWGRAIVRAEGGAPVTASAGQRVYVDPGLLPSAPVPFDKSIEDEFDAWNRERAKQLALGDQALPTSIASSAPPLGYSDLGNYGEWVNVDNRQYWRPTVVVDYVPYRTGYWSYVPAYGYVWNGSYPFCYVTSHYGRWNYMPSYGWMWCYDPVWSPAWCATVRYGSYFCWTPYDIYNRPCTYGSAYFSVGGIRFGVFGTSFSYADEFFYGPCSVYPATQNIFVNININSDDVHFWDIYSPTYHRPYPNYYGVNALAREYSPRRVIRGLDVYGDRQMRASERIGTLEARSGRAQFQTVDSSRFRAVRTSYASADRNARTREVRLPESTPADSRTIVTRAQRDSQYIRATSDLNARTRGRSTNADMAVAPGTGSTATNRTNRTMRTNRETSVDTRSTSPTGLDEALTRRGRSVDANAPQRTTTPADGGAGSVSRNSVRQRQTTPPVGDIIGGGSSATTRQRQTTPPVSGITNGSAGGNSVRQRQTTPPVGDVISRGNGNSGRQRTTIPPVSGAIGNNSNAGASQRTPIRDTTAPITNTRGRAYTPQTTTSAPQSSSRVMTMPRNPIQSTPVQDWSRPESRVQAPTPQRFQTSVPQAPVTQAPQSIAREPRVYTPQIQRREAPTYTPQADSPSYTPQRFEAPRSIERPSYQAPAQRFEAPQRVERPAFTPPSISNRVESAPQRQAPSFESHDSGAGRSFDRGDSGRGRGR